MNKTAKRIISAILTVSMLFAMSATTFAEGSEIINVTSKQLAVGEEWVDYGDVAILDTVTLTDRNIVTRNGADISIYNENFASGIATLSTYNSIFNNAKRSKRDMGI